MNPEASASAPTSGSEVDLGFLGSSRCHQRPTGERVSSVATISVDERVMSSASRSAASFWPRAMKARKKAAVVARAHRGRLPDARGVAQHLLGFIELPHVAVRARGAPCCARDASRSRAESSPTRSSHARASARRKMSIASSMRPTFIGRARMCSACGTSDAAAAYLSVFQRIVEPADVLVR